MSEMSEKRIPIARVDIKIEPTTGMEILVAVQKVAFITNATFARHEHYHNSKYYHLIGCSSKYPMSGICVKPADDELIDPSETYHSLTVINIDWRKGFTFSKKVNRKKIINQTKNFAHQLDSILNFINEGGE